MLINGGNDGFYCVDCQPIGASELLAAKRPEEEESLIWVSGGGDSYEVTLQDVVTLDQVLEAARVYFEEGTLSPNLVWGKRERP
jgi:hypothetical protein